MTIAIGPATGQPTKPHRPLRLIAVVIATLVLILTGAGIGVTLAVLSAASTASSAMSDYTYYQQMIGRYRETLGRATIANHYAWMTGQPGFAWMMGGSRAPGWMAGGTLPRFMMGSSTDVGQVIGRLFAAAPGPKMSPVEAAKLGEQVPSGAVVDRAANRITFTTSHARLDVVAGAAGGRGGTFRIGGLANPTIVVPTGAQVNMRVINAAPDSAHGFAITTAGAASSFRPMMSAAAAFPGGAVWFLADPTSTGMHVAILTFTASKAGTYTYLCPVPGHAQKGMAGTFTVGSYAASLPDGSAP